MSSENREFRVARTLIARERHEVGDIVNEDDLPAAEIDGLLEMGAIVPAHEVEVEGAVLTGEELRTEIWSAITEIPADGFTKGKSPKPTVEAIEVAQPALAGLVSAKLRDEVWDAMKAEGLGVPETAPSD